jgi:uncharacterized C2H2 Zn-finger protein
MSDTELPQPVKYTCPECELVYEKPQGLGIHRRTVHGVIGVTHHKYKPKQHKMTGTQQVPCPECGIKYQAKYLYYSHLPRQHGIKMAAGATELVHVPRLPVVSNNHAPAEQDYKELEGFRLLVHKDGSRWLAERID